jgi:hypothetical protein
VKRSPTPTPEDDEQYEDMRRNYEDERNVRFVCYLWLPCSLTSKSKQSLNATH